MSSKGINNTEKFLLCLLLLRAEQGLGKAKALSAFHTAMLARKMGGDIGETGDPN